MKECSLDKIINGQLVLIVSEFFSAISSRCIIEAVEAVEAVEEDQSSSQKVSRTCE